MGGRARLEVPGELGRKLRAAAGDSRYGTGSAEGGPALREIRQGRLHLQRVRFLSPNARGRSGRLSSFCQYGEPREKSATDGNSLTTPAPRVRVLSLLDQKWSGLLTPDHIKLW